MKLRNKIILIIVCAFMAILLGNNKVNAEVIAGGSEDDGVHWSLDTDTGVITFSGNGMITGWPEKIDDHKLDVKSLIIEDGITNIFQGTFDGCKNLKNITLSKNLICIDMYVFSGCTNLINIEWSTNSVTSAIYEKAFEGCKSLENLKLPDSLTFIGSNAFNSCGLRSIIIPNNTTTICGGAFKDCKNLESITIPNSVTDIGYHGPLGDEFFSDPFEGCDNLTIYCYKNSTVDKLAKENNWKIKYLDDDGKSDGTSTNYTNLPTKTINNQKYITGINPEKNTVNEILSSSNFASGTTVKAYKYGQEISGDEKIGTGTVIKVFENNEEKTEYVAIVYGDTDGDGDMTAVDALAIVKNKTGEVPFTTDAQKEAAKISTKDDGDEAGAVDALAITLIIIGKANWNEKTGSVEYVGQSDDDVEAPTVSIDHELTLRQQ